MRVTAIQLHPITNGPDVVLMVPIEHRVDVTPHSIGIANQPPLVVAEGSFWKIASAGQTSSALFDRVTIGEDEAPDQ